MTGIRLSGTRGLPEELLSPGDTILVGESVVYITTVGTTAIPAAALLSGTIYRSGSTAAYADTLDTAANVIAVLAGNLPAGPIVPGHAFKCRIISSVAFTDSLVLGAGMVAGSSNNFVVGSSGFKDLLFTIQSVQPILQIPAVVTNGSAVITFVLPVGMTALPVGVAPNSLNIMPGASVTGTGIPANTTVLGITQGQGGLIGITLSANATATGALVALSFGPTIKVENIGTGFAS